MKSGESTQSAYARAMHLYPEAFGWCIFPSKKMMRIGLKNARWKLHRKANRTHHLHKCWILASIMQLRKFVGASLWTRTRRAMKFLVIGVFALKNVVMQGSLAIILANAARAST